MILLDLGKLSVSAEPSSEFPDYFDVTIVAQAHPFQGSLTQPLSRADFESWISQMEADPPEVLTLGGNRAMILKLQVYEQGPSEYSLEAWLAWTEDDPYPNLTWLIFEVRPFWKETAERVRALLNGG